MVRRFANIPPASSARPEAAHDSQIGLVAVACEDEVHSPTELVVAVPADLGVGQRQVVSKAPERGLNDVLGIEAAGRVGATAVDARGHTPGRYPGCRRDLRRGSAPVLASGPPRGFLIPLAAESPVSVPLSSPLSPDRPPASERQAYQPPTRCGPMLDPERAREAGPSGRPSQAPPADPGAGREGAATPDRPRYRDAPARPGRPLGGWRASPGRRGVGGGALRRGGGCAPTSPG